MNSRSYTLEKFIENIDEGLKEEITFLRKAFI